MATAATIASLASIASSLTTTGLSIAGTIKQDKAVKRQESREEEERRRIRNLTAKKARQGFAGTVLAPRGLGGTEATAPGAATLLGGA